MSTFKPPSGKSASRVREGSRMFLEALASVESQDQHYEPDHGHHDPDDDDR